MTVAQCLDYWFDNYVSTTLRKDLDALPINGYEAHA